MTNIFHALITIILWVGIFSCTSENKPKDSDTTNQNQEMTITGTVGNIESGKDGYTTPIKTESGETYLALVSISNVGGMENFTRFETGNLVTISGEFWTSGEEKHLTVRKIIKVDSSNTDLMIYEDSYYGIKPGDEISTHEKYLKKEVLPTGEGDFDIFRIQSKSDDQTTVGFLFPDPNDKALVGDIVVDMAAAKTAAGIHVGSTFQDLKEKLPDMEVHGSEIEGRTYARYNNLSYRLDVANFSYEIDVDQIPVDTKVTEIVINFVR